MVCAWAAIFLTIGNYVDVFLGAGYILAVFALMLPLSKNFWGGSLLAAVGAVLLAFMFCAFSYIRLVPFLMFFGLHPTVNYLQKKYVKKKPLHVLAFLLKAVWFDLVMWFCWQFIFVAFFGVDQASWYDFVMQYFYIVLFVGGTVAFAVYDYLIFACQRTADWCVKRIRR